MFAQVCFYPPFQENIIARKIIEDHNHFRDVVSGKTRKQLKGLIKSGGFISQRPSGGKFRVSIPGIEQPRFTFGPSKGKQLGRGEGEEGDVIGYEPGDGNGNGNGKGQKAGDDHVEGVTVGVDFEDFLQFLQEELELPEMRPKPTETFEDIKIRYNGYSKVGPNALRHTRRTLITAIKRLASMGELDRLQTIPGMRIPLPLISVIRDDFRYRQYNEVKIPSSNAVAFFVRDCSGSMDDYRCDIVSDMSWWIDMWIKQFYDRLERCYIVHDTKAEEVSEEKFYTYRHGGGTRCSSAFNMIADVIEKRFPPEHYNIYVFYFTDGENWGSSDNELILSMLEDTLGSNVVNLVGVTEVCSYTNSLQTHSLKGFLDQKCEIVKSMSKKKGFEHLRTTDVGAGQGSAWGGEPMDEGERNERIIHAIKDLIGNQRTYT